MAEYITGKIWNADFNTTWDAITNSWTGSHSFTCLMDEVMSNLPEKNESCSIDGFQFLKLKKATIRQDRNKAVIVNCEYEGTENPEDGTFDKPSIVSESWIGETKFQIDKINIEDHPYFKDDDALQDNPKLGLVADIRAGRLIKYTSATLEDQDVWQNWKTDGTWEFVYLNKTDKLNTLLNYINNGKRSVEQTTVIYTVRRKGFRNNISNYIKNLNKEETDPPGQPIKFSKLNYKLMGVQSSYDGELFNIELEYHGSFTPIDDELEKD